MKLTKNEKRRELISMTKVQNYTEGVDCKINKQHIQFKHFINHKKLYVNGKEYWIQYENNNFKKSAKNTIGMPWVEGLQKSLNKSLILPF